MREIKFRAWDTTLHRMRDENDVDGPFVWPSLLAIGLHGLPICIDKDSFKEHEIVGWNRDHNLILMQYTGLQDKNGKDIYEGDILTHLMHDGLYFRVVWEGRGWHLHSNEDHNWSEWSESACEVIGNIYEKGKIIATTIDNDVIVFNSQEELDQYNAKLMINALDNGFTTSVYDQQVSDSTESAKQSEAEGSLEDDLTKMFDLDGAINEYFKKKE